jgi:hypothetical protein
VGERDRERHQLLGLADREAEHQALVPRAAGVDAHRDVGRLLVDRREDGAGLIVEAVLRAGVADVADRLADDLRDVDVRARRDLARDERGPGRHERLAGDPAVGIVGEDRVEDPVGDLVGDLVRVSLGDRLGREERARQRHLAASPA